MQQPQPIPAAPGAYRLVKNGTVLYVGHTDNLARRYDEWRLNPQQNHCVQAHGWDQFVWHSTGSVAAAELLERQWFDEYRPPCNRQVP